MLARQLAVGLGIAIVLPLLIYYGVVSFYPGPKWEDLQQSNAVQTNVDRHRSGSERQRTSQDLIPTPARDFARVIAIAATTLGAAAIVLGAFLRPAAIGFGLILGGTMAVAAGYWGYWQFLQDWLRFVSLLVIFGALIFAGYWQSSADRSKPSG